MELGRLDHLAVLIGHRSHRHPVIALTREGEIGRLHPLRLEVLAQLLDRRRPPLAGHFRPLDHGDQRFLHALGLVDVEIPRPLIHRLGIIRQRRPQRMNSPRFPLALFLEPDLCLQVADFLLPLHDAPVTARPALQAIQRLDAFLRRGYIDRRLVIHRAIHAGNGRLVHDIGQALLGLRVQPPPVRRDGIRLVDDAPARRVHAVHFVEIPLHARQDLAALLDQLMHGQQAQHLPPRLAAQFLEPLPGPAPRPAAVLARAINRREQGIRVHVLPAFGTRPERTGVRLGGVRVEVGSARKADVVVVGGKVARVADGGFDLGALECPPFAAADVHAVVARTNQLILDGSAILPAGFLCLTESAVVRWILH